LPLSSGLRSKPVSNLHITAYKLHKFVYRDFCLVSCSPLKVNGRFGGIFRLHLRGLNVELRLLKTGLSFPSRVCEFTEGRAYLKRLASGFSQRQVRVQVKSCGVFGGQSGTGGRFPSGTSVSAATHSLHQLLHNHHHHLSFMAGTIAQ
jgi:hypothetical protein